MKQIKMEIERCVSCPYCIALEKGWYCRNICQYLNNVGIYENIHQDCPLPDYKESESEAK